MAAPHGGRYLLDMTDRFLSLVALVVLAVFGAFSGWVVVAHGYLGFIDVARKEPWALQMLIDLVIACLVAIGWMIGDARRRRITVWPFVAVTLVAGSIGVLAYLIRRAIGGG